MNKLILKGKGTSLLLFFTFLFFISLVGTLDFVSAQPPFQAETGSVEGLTLRFPPVSFIKEGANITANMHVFNSSNNLALSNSTVTCFVHLYNSVGDHLVNKQMEFSLENKEFALNISGGNFTIGRHGFIIWCNSSTAGGFVSGAFEVTPTGLTSNLGFYVLVLILSFGIIIFGVTRNDPVITLLGSFGLYFLGLYILFNVFVGVKDLVTTWAIGIIMLGLAMYVSLRSAYSLITKAE